MNKVVILTDCRIISIVIVRKRTGEKNLKIFYQNLIHVTYLAYGLKNVATIRAYFPVVNELIANVKKYS